MRNPYKVTISTVRVYTFKDENECLDQNENFLLEIKNAHEF